MSEFVQLKVDSVYFEVERETLLKTPYFEALLTRWSTNEVQIEQSPEVFQKILYLLEEPYYCFPETHFQELDYYGILPPIKPLYRTTFQSTVKKLSESDGIKPENIIAQYIAERCFLYSQGNKYRYSSVERLWTLDFESNEIYYEIEQLLEPIKEYFRQNLATSLYRKLECMTFVNNLRHTIINCTQIPEVEVNSKELLAVSNGVINLQRMQFQKRQCEAHITNYHPVKYNPEVKTDELVSVLKQLLGDNLDQFKDVMKRLIFDRECLRVSFVGSFSSGKSTLAQLLQCTFTTIIIPRNDLTTRLHNYEMDTLYMIDEEDAVHLFRGLIEKHNEERIEMPYRFVRHLDDLTQHLINLYKISEIQDCASPLLTWLLN